MEKGGSTKRQSHCVKELWRSGKRYTVFPPSLTETAVRSAYIKFTLLRTLIHVVAKSVIVMLTCILCKV